MIRQVQRFKIPRFSLKNVVPTSGVCTTMFYEDEYIAEYVGKELRRGGAGRSYEERRRRLVRSLMKEKVRSAEVAVA